MNRSEVYETAGAVFFFLLGLVSALLWAIGVYQARLVPIIAGTLGLIVVSRALLDGSKKP